MIEGGLALNDTGFILVQAMCPTSNLSRSAAKSRLLKRKAWDGSKMGGTHIPTGGSAGNSSEPKRVVSLELAMAKVAEKWVIR